MRRIATILAHVLATTTVVACGGKVTTEGPEPGPTTTATATATGPAPTVPTTPQPPVPWPPGPDAGPPQVDAGCTQPPKLVSQGATCADTWYHPCGVPIGVDPSDGLTEAECAIVCGGGAPGPGRYWGCAQHLPADVPGPAFDCFTCVEGRRPEGYVEPETFGTVAGWLAHATDLERVSIDAFQILQRELLHYGAPIELVESAARAEADEVRHARVMGVLATREGATLSTTPVTHGAPRALVDIAIENAVEGCIRETYGAVVAGYQAEHASRLDVRRLMSSIYRDETAHAELAWQVHEWALAQLTEEEHLRVSTAMSETVTELARAASSTASWDLDNALGLPPADQAQKLVRGLRVHLWMRALAA